MDYEIPSGYNSSDMDIVTMEHREVNPPPTTSLTDLRTNALTVRSITNEKYEGEKENCCRKFDSWCTDDQIDFIEDILLRMTHFQHGHIHAFLKPMLQRDFITLLPGNTVIKMYVLNPSPTLLKNGKRKEVKTVKILQNEVILRFPMFHVFIAIKLREFKFI